MKKENNLQNKGLSCNDDNTMLGDDADLYYIQTSYIGNAILWWGVNSTGYTTDIKRAGKYTKEQAKEIIKRPQDIAWKCKHIDNNESAKVLIIDHQYLNKRHRLVGKSR